MTDVVGRIRRRTPRTLLRAAGLAMFLGPLIPSLGFDVGACAMARPARPVPPSIYPLIQLFYDQAGRASHLPATHLAG